MAHLGSEDLIDILEGLRSEAAEPHLGSCAACREQLGELRAAMLAAQQVEVPEPSPPFWDHLSERVRQAVAADAGPRRSWLHQWAVRPALPLALGALACLLVAASLTIRSSLRQDPRAPAALSVTPEREEPRPEVLGAADDPSLQLVADLTSDMDWDGVSEAGLATYVAGDNDAVSELSDNERRELQRLLKQELEQSGMGSVVPS